MTKIIIGGQGKNDEQLTNAIINAKDGDIIALLPGVYFSTDSPFVCTLRQSLTFQGQSKDSKDVVIYSSFSVGNDTTSIFKNLTINFTANGENTLAAYDEARVYLDNVIIDRGAPDVWDTIYVQNSFISIKDTKILTGSKHNSVGLSLENSQLFADNLSVQLMFQKKSITYLKDSTIWDSLKLRHQSITYFHTLAFDTLTESFTNIDIKSDSQFNGQNLKFDQADAQIHISKSSADIKQLEKHSLVPHFKFDADSKVNLAGQEPLNEGPITGK